MVNFIMDPRLVHWYAQNFDLLGCGAFTGNSPIAPGHPAARKVSALPIGGEGLHRLSCTGNAFLATHRGDLALDCPPGGSSHSALPDAAYCAAAVCISVCG